MTKFQKGVSNLGAKVFNMLPSNIKMESDNPKKFKMALQDFLRENSFYSLDEYFPYPQLPTYIINQFVFTTSPDSTIKRLSWYGIILLCQIIYEALEMQILLIKYCDYLSMSNNLYGARETNIVLIVLYPL